MILVTCLTLCDFDFTRLDVSDLDFFKDFNIGDEFMSVDIKNGAQAALVELIEES